MQVLVDAQDEFFDFGLVETLVCHRLYAPSEKREFFLAEFSICHRG